MKLPTLKGREISSLIKEGKWIKKNCYLVCFKVSEDRKFAFAASKSIQTKVQKNRVKRVLKEIIRTSQELLPAGHYLVIGTEAILKSKYLELKEMLIRDLRESFQD